MQYQLDILTSHPNFLIEVVQFKQGVIVDKHNELKKLQEKTFEFYKVLYQYYQIC